MTSARFRLYYPFFILLIPSLIWIGLDQTPWPWDQAWYGQVALELAMRSIYDFRGWVHYLFHAFGTKAPGIAWIGQLFAGLGLLTGFSEGSLLLFGCLCQAVCLGVIFSTTRKSFHGSRGAARIAALFAAAAPAFFGMSHQFFVEPLQALTVALFLWLAGRWRSLARVDAWMALVIFGSLSMLAKVTSPLYVVGPVLTCFLLEFRKGPLRPFRSPRSVWLVVAASIIFLLTLTWYWVNLRILVSFVHEATTGQAAYYYGSRGPFLSKARVWASGFRIFFFLGPSWVIGIILLCLALTLRLSRGLRWRGSDLLALISFIQIGLCFWFFTRQVNEEWRYAYPLLSYFAYLAGWTIFQLRPWTLLVRFSGIYLLLQWVWLALFSLSLAPLPWAVPIFLFPAQRDGYRHRRMEAWIKETCRPDTRSKYSIVGLEIEDFNANTAAFIHASLAGINRINCYYASLGYVETDADRAWKALQSQSVAYFVTLDPQVSLPPKNVFNQISQEILERVRRSPTFSRISVPGFPELLLFKTGGQNPTK